MLCLSKITLNLRSIVSYVCSCCCSGDCSCNTSSSTEAIKVGKQHPLYTKQQLTSVRRFYNSTTKTHRLVEDSTEIAKLQKSTKWRDEGVVFYTATYFMDFANGFYDDWTFYNQMRVGHFVFEMHHDVTGRVLYTTDSKEMDALVKQGWTYNPDLVFVSGGDSFVHRLYNRSTKRHLFTMSEKERDNLVRLVGNMKESRLVRHLNHSTMLSQIQILLTTNLEEEILLFFLYCQLQVYTKFTQYL